MDVFFSWLGIDVFRLRSIILLVWRPQLVYSFRGLIEHSIICILEFVLAGSAAFILLIAECDLDSFWDLGQWWVIILVSTPLIELGDSGWGCLPSFLDACRHLRSRVRRVASLQPLVFRWRPGVILASIVTVFPLALARQRWPWHKRRRCLGHGLVYDIHILPQGVLANPLDLLVRELVASVVNLLVVTDGLAWLSPLYPGLPGLAQCLGVDAYLPSLICCVLLNEISDDFSLTESRTELAQLVTVFLFVFIELHLVTQLRSTIILKRRYASLRWSLVQPPAHKHIWLSVMICTVILGRARICLPHPIYSAVIAAFIWFIFIRCVLGVDEIGGRLLVEFLFLLHQRRLCLLCAICLACSHLHGYFMRHIVDQTTVLVAALIVVFLDCHHVWALSVDQLVGALVHWRECIACHAVLIGGIKV